MGLSSYAKLSYRLFKNKAHDMAAKNKALDVALEQAQMKLRPEVFMSLHQVKTRLLFQV